MRTLFIAATLALSIAAPVAAQNLRAYLVSQWFENGNKMCRYDNGTVLNMGAKLCPLSIPK